MRYMIIEHFKEGGAGEIYRRFAQQGRMMPAELRYIDSWVSEDLRICYQLMETDDFSLFSQWTRQWEDLVEFEIVPVIPSADACAKAVAS